MKRSFVIFLAITLLAVLCACGPASVEDPTTSEITQATETTAPESGELLVGYARAEITPKITVPLCGFGSTSSRMANTVLEPLYTTCTAVTGGNGKTVLLIAMDLQRASDVYVPDVKSMIHEATGIPEENIYISASHTHAGPDVDNGSETFFFTYIDELCEAITEVALEALLDRQPAQMSYGSIETENLTFTRHYKYTSTGGSITYAFGGVDTVANSGIAEHVTEADETMHVIRFAREDDKDVVMVNWRAHPLMHSGEGRLQLSADFIGSFRTAFELMTDCNFVYFQGAAGNMNSITAIPAETRTEDNNVYGALLADYAVKCLQENMQPAEGTEVMTRQTILDAQVDLELNAITIGDSVAFVTAPNELFDSSSVYVEENSPYPMNFTLELTNGHKGYLPTKKMYNFGGYEWYEVGVAKTERGTAERVQETFLELLQELDAADPALEPIVELGQIKAPETSEPSQPVTLYWNVYRQDYAPGGTLDHSSRTKEDDGYYHVVFAVDGKQETLLVKDKNLIEIIEFNDITGLVLDENGVVTDVKVLRECTGGRAANRAIVMGVEGNTVSCATAAQDGVDFTLTLTEQTKTYDVSTADETCGMETTLQEGDQIIALYDADGAISHVYVLRRAHVDDLEHADHCVCGGAAEGLHGECAAVTEWVAWGDDPAEWDVLPTESGYYYLTRDVVLSKRHKSLAGEDIIICLNGKDVTMAQSNMISVLGTLSICDCRYTCEGGEYTYAGTLYSTYSNESALGGMFYVHQNAGLNLYSGNYIGTGYWKRGGIIYTATYSTTNLYNACLDGGTSMNEGGCIYLNNGDLNIYGGVITGGNASLKGSGICFNNGNLCISGSPKITGNQRDDLFLRADRKITIGEGGLQEGAEINIQLASGTGVFATGASKEDAKYFTAKDGTVSWNPETGELFIEAAG